jgi:hypothetical protein
MSTEEEIWKDIPGYEGYYQASNLGRIKSLSRWKKVFLTQRIFKPESILFQKNSSNGYKIVTLSVDAAKKTRTIHRIVAECFIGNQDGLKDVNHKDGDKHNNKPDNLEWMNRSQNIKHAYDTGLRTSTRGTAVWTNKLTEAQVVEIFHSPGIHSEIGKRYGVLKAAVQHIKSGRSWKHLKLLENNS